MNRKHDLHTYMFAQSIHPGVVIACCEAFCQTSKQQTVIMYPENWTGDEDRMLCQ